MRKVRATVPYAETLPMNANTIRFQLQRYGFKETVERQKMLCLYTFACKGVWTSSFGNNYLAFVFYYLLKQKFYSFFRWFGIHSTK